MILLYGQGCWGKGDTFAEAKRELRKAGYRLTEPYFVWSVPFDAWVGEDGVIRWRNPKLPNGKPNTDYDIEKLGGVNIR